MTPFKYLAQWLVLGGVVGAACGVASAVFLTALAYATDTRDTHAWLVFLLPVAGLGLGLAYGKLGEPIKAGNNLVIDTIHDGGPEIPFRMLPMVLVGTVLTHLFGGSAGREGTAVQMGASLADFASHRARLSPMLRTQLLAAGVAGGFGSVFGTPIAGAIFGLEFVVLGRIEYRALVPALVASVVGDLVTRGLGVEHTAYPAIAHLSLSPLVVLRWLVFAVIVAAVAIAFIELAHLLKRRSARHVPHLGLRMAIGGAAIVGLWQLVGGDYLGLGIPLIERSFVEVEPWAFALKLVFTALTLGVGFVGGEVTPLFVIGATLGSVVGPLLGLPREISAGVGLAAMFAAASNTPIALSIMAVELFGAEVLPHVVIVCVVAYVITGSRTIYPSQRQAKPGV